MKFCFNYLASEGDFFYYDIPQGIARYMHVSNPGNIYPVAALSQYYLSSFVGSKFIPVVPRGRTPITPIHWFFFLSLNRDNI